jgi:hypothetical protein
MDSTGSRLGQIPDLRKQSNQLSDSIKAEHFLSAQEQLPTFKKLCIMELLQIAS